MWAHLVYEKNWRKLKKVGRATISLRCINVRGTRPLTVWGVLLPTQREKNVSIRFPIARYPLFTLLFATANGGPENPAGVQYSRTPVHACLIDTTDDWNLRSAPCTLDSSPVPLHHHTTRRSAFRLQKSNYRSLTSVITKVCPFSQL
jgi:hypothetical protein